MAIARTVKQWQRALEWKEEYRGEIGQWRGDEDIKNFAKALKTNTTIKTLNLYGNSIGAAGAIAVAEAIMINKTITSLNLAGNSIGEDGAIAVAEAMKINKTITSLTLAYNSIGDDGALAVAEAMKINKTIHTLTLQNNSIGADGAIAVAEAMKINKTITSLILAYNSIGDDGALAVAEAMKINKTIKSLTLNDNSIGEAGALAVAEAVKINKTIKSLTGVDLQKHITLLGLPEEFSNQSNVKILAYLKQIKQSSQDTTVYRMRVMLVGPPEAGKTTLVHRTMTDEFQRDQFSRTDGVSMKEWSPSLTDADHRMSISLWDFGGQEVYQNSHPMFFSDRTLYVLVWNPLGTSISTLEQYVVNIRNRTKTAPIMLVTTHSGEVTVADDDECVLALKDKCSVSYNCTPDSHGSLVASTFPLDNRNSGINGEVGGCLKEISSTWKTIDGGVHVEWKHFPLDSKEGAGLKGFRECLIQFIKVYSPLVSIPAWYNSLELKLRELSSLSQFSIDREEFCSLCRSAWSDTPPASDAEANDRIKSVLYLFHHWGIIYLLPDPSCSSGELGDGNGDIVLNPQDLADVVAAVITFQRPLEDGVLYHDQAEDIWPESRYASRLHPQFLLLFHNCEMAYEIYDSQGNPSGKSLVPARLPELPTPVHLMTEDNLREKMFGVWESKSDPTLKVKNHMISRGYVKITFDCLLPSFFPKLLVRLRHMSSSSVSHCSRHHCVVHLAERQSGSLSGRVVGWSVCCVVEDCDSRSLFVYPGGCSYGATSILYEAVQGLLQESFSGMVVQNVDLIVGGESSLDEHPEFLIWQSLFTPDIHSRSINHIPLSNSAFLHRQEFLIFQHYLEMSDPIQTTIDRIRLYKLILSSINMFRKEGLGLSENPALLWLAGKDTQNRVFLYPISPSLSPTETWSVIWNSKVPFDVNPQSVVPTDMSNVLLRLLPLMFSHDTLPFAKDNVKWIGIPNLRTPDHEAVSKIERTVPQGFQMVRNLCGQLAYHCRQKYNGLDEALYEVMNQNEQMLHLHLSSKLLSLDIPELKATLMKCQRRIGKDYWHTFISAKQVIRHAPLLDRVALLQLAMLKDPIIEDHWKRKILFGLLISQGLTIVKEADTIVAPIHESNLENALMKLSLQHGPGSQPKVQFLSREQQCEHQSLKPPGLLFFCEERNIVEGLLISDLVKHILRGLAMLFDEDHVSPSFRLKSVSSVMNKLFYRGKDLSDLFAASAKTLEEFHRLANHVKGSGGIFFDHTRNNDGYGSEVLKYYRVLQVDISAIKGDGRSYNPLLFPVFYEIVLLTSNDRAPHEVYELKRLKCTLFEKIESSPEVRNLLTLRNISFEHPAVPSEEIFDGEEEKGN